MVCVGSRIQGYRDLVRLVRVASGPPVVPHRVLDSQQVRLGSGTEELWYTINTPKPYNPTGPKATKESLRKPRESKIGS